MNQATVDEFNLHSSVVPIISRSEQLKGVRLTNKDYDNLIALGKKVYFFAPGNADGDELTNEQRNYIQWGEGKGYNKNYKCRIRAKWYYVPQTWCADAFLIR